MNDYQVMPSLSDEDYAALKADIAERGVQVAVEYDEQGNILDGYHRVKACGELGVKNWPSVVRIGLTEEQKRTHARQLNLARRHLNREQRQRLIAAQLKETPQKSDRQIAAELQVSNSTVSEARKQLQDAGELCESHTSIGGDGKEYPRRVERQSRSAVYVDKPRDVERVAAAVAVAGDAIPDKRLELKRLERIAREQALEQHSATEKGAALPSDLFQTIVADPPWAYENEATRAAAEDHYPTMTIDELCAMPVAQRAAENAHLYLWVTNPMLEVAFRVVRAWGFEYKTLLTWVKPQMGLGNYFRGCTEHVMFAVRGSLPVQQHDLRNWFESPRLKHSEKPQVFFDLVETASPAPRLELFARRQRPGWHVWGNEV